MAKMLFQAGRMLGLLSVLLAATRTTAAPSLTEDSYIDFPYLINATIENLQYGLEQIHFTSVDLVEAYTARILEVNDTVHAVVEINPDALSIAAELDAQRRDGKYRGPLHGIPILIKNNIATADKMQNTAGSYALLGATVPEDSGVAAKLRQAGAIILGKTNMNEWANFRSTNSSNGWSAYGGQTFGAYFPEQDPSGSSSGSGVASSLGLALASLGTETSGSILSPCDVASLACVKPTVGLTSRALVVPISQHQDTVGPMARTVKDAAYLLGAIAGRDENDNYTSAIPFREIPDYVKACKTDALKGKRIGIPSNLVPTTDDPLSIFVRDTLRSTVEILSSAGAIIVSDTNFTGYDELLISESWQIVVLADFLADLPTLYLSKLEANPTGVQDVADIRNFTQSTPVEEYPDRNTEAWDLALDKYGFNNTDPRFWAAYQEALRLAGPLGLTGALQNYSLDAVFLPTYLAAFVPAILGTPVVTVPLGYLPPDTERVPSPRGDTYLIGPNQPFGLSFLGPKFSEELLIGLAYDFEQRTMVRNKVQPYILPKTELVDIVVVAD